MHKCIGALPILIVVDFVLNEELRYLCAATGYFGSSPYLKPDNFPSNTTAAGLAEGLAAAHKAYGAPEYVLSATFVLSFHNLHFG